MGNSFCSLLLLLVVLSCENKPGKQGVAATVTDSSKQKNGISSRNDTTKVEDYFVDSMNIGRKSYNKVEFVKYQSPDTGYVVIRFFSKRNRRWVKRNEFHFEKDDVIRCDPQISDFNNDGYRDVTYVSRIAARAANEVRTLFIYNNRGDGLIHIKNSEDYPNMLYNRDLNCIDAFLVYGGCSTVFLRLKKDSLKEFASVELMDGITVRTYDKQDKETIIFQDSANKGSYVRYKNFKPLIEYKEP